LLLDVVVSVEGLVDCSGEVREYSGEVREY
jgi:hypothetical protein